ncbi:MAG: soluble lytic murein transglycosylase [Dinoroseobacter sp.]|jgi:soluble lytic murein transglycosylase
MIPRLTRVLALVLCILSLPALTAQAQSQRAQTLTSALDAARASDWDRALDMARALPDQQARDVVIWHWLRAPRGQFDDYLNFLARNGDWPGLPLMRRRGEASIPQGASLSQLQNFFGPDAPQTGTGSLRMADALRANGRAAEADALIIKAWREFVLGAQTEQAFLSLHRNLIAPHHTARLDQLLWDGNTSAAARMQPLVNAGWRALAEARIALRTDRNGVNALIDAVPRALANDPGLAYERYRWRLDKRRLASAIELMEERSGSLESLGRPEYWADRRADLARDLMRDDNDRAAYRVAARHHLPTPEAYGDYSELEWLAGFIALRKLNDAETALAHFKRFGATVTSPISAGRAGYWEGRAYEALGQSANATEAYRRGAQHQTAFYGQLAAERAGLPTDPALPGREIYPDWRSQGFMATSVLQAALLLQEASERDLAERWMVHLSERLDLQQRGSLADLALHLREPHIALRLAKWAASEGEILHRAYHPLTDLADANLTINPALTLSIARRESEFDPVVISGAGAMGLMQVMPRTGQETASKMGLAFSQDRLLSDPAYNARLGSDYIRRQIEDFGTALTLVASAYNAGPSRPRAWINRFGDPRLDSVDVIDWIEHVPFTETRNYIMRVTESRVVYGMILAGRPLPLDVIDKLKGR